MCVCLSVELACVLHLGCLRTYIYMYQRHTFRNTNACLRHSGTDSESPPIILQHWYYSVISTKSSINPILVRSSSSSSCRSSSFLGSLLCSGSPFTPPPANWSTLHCGGLPPYTVYDSCLKQSIKAMCYQKECILCRTWFEFEPRGSELQIEYVTWCLFVSCAQARGHTCTHEQVAVWYIFHWLRVVGSYKLRMMLQCINKEQMANLYINNESFEIFQKLA